MSQKNNKKTTAKKKPWGIIITIVVVIALMGSLFAINKLSESKKIADGVFNLDDRPFLGDENAPVTLVEFADFKCPACKVWSSDVYSQIEKDFIETGKAKIYFMNFPIIAADSITAMEAARSVYKQDPASFWVLYEKLYENQKDESEAWATTEYLTELITEYTPNIDVEQVKKDIENNTYYNDIEDDYNQGIKANVKGTPTLFIDGKMMDSAFDYEKITDAIEKGQ